MLAPFGHAAAVASCLLLGEERTWLGRARRSEFDPGCVKTPNCDIGSAHRGC
jgi:hypothetical protein